MSRPGSVQAQLNDLRAQLDDEKRLRHDIEQELSQTKFALRRATALLRDIDKASVGVGAFLRSVP